MNKKTNILIVNDDGIESYGIAKLAAMAANFGDVWVVAPEGQCSGMSQRLTIFSELNVQEREFPATVRAAYSVSGTPADCVKTAIKSLLPIKPDVVFSGINSGFNTGFDIAYSGTVGAAMEALLNGVPAIAFSETHVGCREVTDMFLYEIARELIKRPLAGEIWNVNFPDCTLNEYRGILRDVKIEPHCFFENFYNTAENENGCALSPYAELLDPERAENGSDRYDLLHFVDFLHTSLFTAKRL